MSVGYCFQRHLSRIQFIMLTVFCALLLFIVYYKNSLSPRLLLSFLFIIFNLRTAAFKAYCAIWVRRSNFRHQASPRVSPRESTQRRNVELWARNFRKFCLNANFHVTFRDFFTCRKAWPTALLSLRRKACWGFFRPKNPTALAGCEPANVGTKGQHATSKAPKPIYSVLGQLFWNCCGVVSLFYIV
jgi:hypothetical protein